MGLIFESGGYGYSGMDKWFAENLAAEVLERVRKGTEQVHSAAELRKDLGLED